MSKTPLCPFLKKPCIEHDCMLYTHVTLMNPQTGVGQDQYGCAIAWMPVLLIEGSSQTRRVQAAVEDSRNEITKRQDTFNQLALDARKGPAKLE